MKSISRSVLTLLVLRTRYRFYDKAQLVQRIVVGKASRWINQRCAFHPDINALFSHELSCKVIVINVKTNMMQTMMAHLQPILPDGVLIRDWLQELKLYIEEVIECGNYGSINSLTAIEALLVNNLSAAVWRYNAAAFPAAQPVDQAICRLKPPVTASKSSISPAKYRPLTFLDSMVEGFISFTDMPPWVMMASL